MTNDLAFTSATEALALFRARELSPVELMTAVIERAEAIEPAINAFADTFYQQALSAARTAQERYAKTGEPPRPLEGIPVAVKEEAPIAGQRNTLGSLPLRDEVARSTAVFAQRIIDAGGIAGMRIAFSSDLGCYDVDAAGLYQPLGELLEEYDALMTLPFSIASRCPVMSVPSGLSRDGVPTGLSIVGRTYDDVTVFRVAAAHEEGSGWTWPAGALS